MENGEEFILMNGSIVLFYMFENRDKKIDFKIQMIENI